MAARESRTIASLQELPAQACRGLTALVVLVPVTVLFAQAGIELDHDRHLVGVNYGMYADPTLVRRHLAPELGVPEIETNGDRSDTADGFQDEVPNR